MDFRQRRAFLRVHDSHLVSDVSTNKKTKAQTGSDLGERADEVPSGARTGGASKPETSIA